MTIRALSKEGWLLGARGRKGEGMRQKAKAISTMWKFDKTKKEYSSRVKT